MILRLERSRTSILKRKAGESELPFPDLMRVTGDKRGLNRSKNGEKEVAPEEITPGTQVGPTLPRLFHR
jgi:hypothetical protein